MVRNIIHLFLLVILLVCSLNATAQIALVKVLESQSRQSVAVAYVNVYSGNKKLPDQTVITDDDGNAQVLLSTFPCRMEVTAIGYDLFTQTITSFPESRAITVPLAKKSAALNEYVVTGLAQAVPKQDALAQYRVISGATLTAQGSVSLADALGTQLNININNDAVLGANISMQGVSGDKVKILIDGMAVNGREAGNIDLGQINLNNIDHIEIVQGPMSVMYGTDAIGGVINLITKKNNKPLTVQAGFNYESIGKYNADVNTSFRLNKRSQLSIGGARNFFQGWKYNDTLYKDPGSGVTFPYHRSLLFNPKEQYLGNVAYNYTAKSGFRLQLAGDYMHEKVTDLSAPSTFSSFGSYADDSYYKTTRAQMRLLMDGKIGENGHWTSQNSYSFYYRVKSSYITDLATEDQTLDQSSGAQDTTQFHDINLRTAYSNKVGKIGYTVGYDVNLEFAKSGKISGGINNVEDYAAYATASIPLIGSKLIAQPAVRAAYNTQYPAPVMPSLNLLWHAGDNLQLRASYGRGFRAPALKELYLEFIDVNHHIIGNPNLHAELSNNFQVSASYQLYHQESDYTQLVLTSYYNDIDNEIDLVNNEPNNPNSIDYTYGNISHLRNTITNVQLESQVRNWYWQAGYGYNYTFDLGTTPIGSSFNAHEANATLQYLWKNPGLKFSVFYKYSGSRPALQNNIDGSATFSGFVSGFSTMDASVEHKFFHRRLQVVAGMKNLFNVQLLTPSGVSVTPTANPHGAAQDVNLLPRRFFTTLRLTL